jgi:all-trans-retinol dehydrogenase (NAD+)
MMIYLSLAFHLLVGVLLMLYGAVCAAVRLLIPYQKRAKSVRDEVVLITGAGSGIGRLMAKRFAKLGAQLVLVDVNAQGNEQTATEVRGDGGQTTTFTCDLSSRENIYQVADEVCSYIFRIFALLESCYSQTKKLQIKKKVGEITILVNNAGIVTGKKFLDASDAEIERTMNVNVQAHFWV